MSQDTCSDAGSSDSSISDLRRRQRDTRSRPWLTNSVLRRRSAALTSSGLNDSVDAPALSASTTVPIVSDLPPSTPVECDREEQCRDSTKEERDSSRLSRTALKAATSVKAFAKAAGSKIPRWVGLKGILSRNCQPPPLDRDGERGKDKTTAAFPTGTGEKTFASRLPLASRTRWLGAGLLQRRYDLANLLLRMPRRPWTKRSATVGLGGVATWRFGRGAELRPSCFKPEPIKTHRCERQLTSILKHRPERSEEVMTLPAPPTEPTSPGKLRKKVIVRSFPTKTPHRHWPKTLIRAWYCEVCRDKSRCVCPEAVAEVHGEFKPTPGLQWLEEQLHLGNDYLELSGGVFGGAQFDCDEGGMDLKMV